jgi:membrane peptidoglycan carboxypeptidase
MRDDEPSPREGVPVEKTQTAGKVVIRFARRAGITALFVLAVMLGSLSGIFFAYANDVAEVSALDDYKPNTITRLLASNGEQIGEFATERRVVIGYDDIAPVLRQAIIASEDADFEKHFGISFSRLIVTAVRTSSPASALARAPSRSRSRAFCSFSSTCAAASSRARAWQAPNASSKRRCSRFS